MAARLPTVGGDDGNWGQILNDFLGQSLNNDGTLKPSAVSASGAATDSTVVHNTSNETIAGTKTFQASPVLPTPTLGSHATTKTYVDSTVSAGAPDATTTNKGLVQLAGDLAGTATAPTVPGLAGKEPTITAGTTGQYYRGDKTFQTLDKTAVGLANVDNTSDANKPVSTATTTALNLKVDKSTATTKGDILAATAASTITRVGVGTDGQILTADAASAPGVRWAAAPTAPVASVVGQTGIITGAQIAADAALTGTYAAKQINDPRGILHAALSNVDAERVAIVMAGSSTTAGTGASAPQLSYVQRVLRGMEGTYPRSTNIPGPGSAFLSVEVSFPATTAGVYVCNAGVASTTSANYLTATTRGQIAAMNPQPRVIIHTIGSNDYAAGMDPATYGANVAVQLADLKTRITGPCVHVLVHSWQRRDVTSPAYPWASYGAQLAAIAAVDPDHVVFVDASDAFARAGIASGDPFDLLEPTGVHGNDAGHALLADVVLDRLLIRGTPPPPVWLRSRFTSDTFTGTGEIVGATTNIGIGGAAKTWGGMATYMAMGAGALTIAQAGSWTVGVPMLYPDYELTCKIIAMPVGAAANIELRRQALDVASTPDTIRLVINTDGSQVIYKRVSGALTSLRYCSSPLVGVGDIITLGVKGTAVWLKVNGYVSASVVVPEITAAGNAAFSSGGATAFSVDNFAVDVLT